MNVPGESRRIQLFVGVIGPPDLVSTVQQLAAREYPALKIVPTPYDDEEQTVDLIRANNGTVDAWLFTGIIPYTIARSAQVLERPATYISYSGATLYRVLVELVGRGIDPSSMSVDTLQYDQVVEALRDADLPTGNIHVLPYSGSRTAADFVSFHSRARTEHGTTMALTCIRSVYSQINNEIETIRLSPALASIRSALQTVSLAGAQRIGSDAQVAIGFIDLPESDSSLVDDVAPLAASLFPLDEGRYLLVTTMGALEAATQGFERLPLLSRLARKNVWARIGIGVGRSASEAEALGRQALARCRTLGPFAMVIQLESGSDKVIMSDWGDHTRDETDDPTSLTVAAWRAGVSRKTLERVKTALSEIQEEENTITANELAASMGIEPRTARRTLQRLERSGFAERIGHVRSGSTGRPPTVYRVRI